MKSWLRLYAGIRKCSSSTIQPHALATATTTTKPQSDPNNDEPVEFETNPFSKEKGQCILCRYGITPDYKNIKLLSQFVSPFTGRLYSPSATRLCSRKHEQVKKEIMKARDAGFMPYYLKDPAFLKDPPLFDPDRPLRPHNY